MRSGVFAFPRIDRIVYGERAPAALLKESDRLGARRVFLIVSGTMNRTTDEVDRMAQALGSRYAGRYDRVPPFNPRYAVLEAAEGAKTAGADLIVTFGGGAVTEAGKLVRLCLKHDITDLDGFDPFRIVVNPDGTRSAPSYEGPDVPQVAIPTTLSAGEFHAGGGSLDHRVKVKHGYAHPLLVPRSIIFDPAATVHTPLWVWLSTGVRALDHCVEGLCSQFAHPVSDATYVQAIRMLAPSLAKVKQDPGDLDARLDSQLGVWLAMAGRQGGVEMGASHAIGHVLGGSFGVPHGYTSCVMLPHVLRYNRCATAERQRIVSEAMGRPGEDAADVIDGFIAALGLPRRLSEVGVQRADFAAIAKKTMRDKWLHTNPRRIDDPSQIAEILEAAA